MDLIISAVAARTGSTLLQRIFNVRKETLIWGEPNRVLTDFYNIYRKLFRFSTGYADQREIYFNKNEDPNCVIQNMNPEQKYVEKMIIAAVRSGFRELYDQYRETHDMIGFKEIYFGKNEIELIRKCYPEVTILLLVRNPIDIWKSSQNWYESVEGFVELWNQNAAYYIDFSDSDINGHLILYEDIVSKEKKTLDFITSIARISEEDFDYVLEYKTWSSRKEIAEEDQEYIEQNCQSIMKLYNYI